MKNMKIALSVGVAALSLATFAAEAQSKESAAATTNKTKRVSLHEIYERKFGGQLVQPGSKQGCLAFVNCQKALPTAAAEMQKVADDLKKMLRADSIVVEGKAIKGMPTAKDLAAVGATVAVFAIENPDLPALLCAPEEKWAFVNVAKLKEGLSSDVVGQGMLRTRFRSEVWRAFALACGGASSQSPVSIFNTADMKSLDVIDSGAISFDVVQRAGNYLQKVLKVTPERVVTYQRACQEGWAPAPTNDVQKTIWKKVHEIPTKPIKIEYDPKASKK